MGRGMNPLIVVCGDSFCSANKTDRLHFSQILQDKYGHNVINLARGGVSMVCIGMQIKTAISLHPAAIIHSSTGSPRFDVPLKNRKFNPALGLKNFSYWHPGEQSTGLEFTGDRNAAILSDVACNFLPDATKCHWDDDVVSPEQKESMKNYLLYLYDDNLKSEVDSWINDYWTMMIQKHNIISIPFSKTAAGRAAYEYADNNPNVNVRYHTDPITQEIVAQELAEILSKIN